MVYGFNVAVAQKYGVDAAIVIQNLYWWISKNQANDKHYHDGRTWTYNSIKAFVKQFPFWSEPKIRRLLKNMEAQGVLHIANYNSNTYDRTQWYALDDSVLEHFQNDQMHVTDLQNACDQSDQMHVTKSSDRSDGNDATIPDSKPYGKSKSKPDGKIPPTPQSQTDERFAGMSDELAEATEEWIAYKAEKHQAYKPKGANALIKAVRDNAERHGDCAVVDVIRRSMSANYQGIVWDWLTRGRPAKSRDKPAEKPSFDLDEYERTSIYDTAGGYV